jgi:hypothetical protein
VNQNRVVTLADLGLVNAQLAQLVTAANYLKDVNASGTLTLADKGITNANLNKAIPPWTRPVRSSSNRVSARISLCQSKHLERSTENFTRRICAFGT